MMRTRMKKRNTMILTLMMTRISCMVMEKATVLEDSPHRIVE